ncbi:unnamed protein product [Mytilus edulis]|uniref:Uncharacterized protein n=1 Tax=Mytilus edulis TaxID=6550 RepID=A0A8S3TP16_MYTED|nr:unnamed protein product [Mytilus edulis]
MLCRLADALEILYPLQNKSMQAVVLKQIGISPGNSVTLTETMVSYLKKVCVKTLVLAENDIVGLGPNILASFQYSHCFNTIVLSGNRFSLVSFADVAQFVGMLYELTNLKVFDFSYNPIKYKKIQYLNIPFLSDTTLVQPLVEQKLIHEFKPTKCLSRKTDKS